MSKKNSNSKKGTFKKAEAPKPATAPEMFPREAIKPEVKAPVIAPAVKKAEAPKVEAKKVEVPKAPVVTKVETPKVETPKVETPVAPIPAVPTPTPVLVAETTPEPVQNEAAIAPVKEEAPIQVPLESFEIQVPAESFETIESIMNLAELPFSLAAVRPTSNHTDEQKLEKFIRLRKGNNPNKVHHMEMMGSGINMTKINQLDGEVGKFILKRHFVSELWTITIAQKTK